MAGVPFRDELLLYGADEWFDVQAKGREEEAKKLSPNDPETAIEFAIENPGVNLSTIKNAYASFKKQKTDKFRNAFLQKEPGASNLNIDRRKSNIQKYLRRAKAVGMVSKNLELPYMSEQNLKKEMSNLEQKEFNELLRQVGVNKNIFNSLNNSQKSSLQNGETEIITRVSKFKNYIKKRQNDYAAEAKKIENNQQAAMNALKKETNVKSLRNKFDGMTNLTNANKQALKQIVQNFESNKMTKGGLFTKSKKIYTNKNSASAAINKYLQNKKKRQQNANAAELKKIENNQKAAMNALKKNTKAEAKRRAKEEANAKKEPNRIAKEEANAKKEANRIAKEEANERKRQQNANAAEQKKIENNQQAAINALKKETNVKTLRNKINSIEGLKNGNKRALNQIVKNFENNKMSKGGLFTRSKKLYVNKNSANKAINKYLQNKNDKLKALKNKAISNAAAAGKKREVNAKKEANRIAKEEANERKKQLNADANKKRKENRNKEIETLEAEFVARSANYNNLARKEANELIQKFKKPGMFSRKMSLNNAMKKLKNIEKFVSVRTNTKQNANKKKGEKEAQEMENNQQAAINALKANLENKKMRENVLANTKALYNKRLNNKKTLRQSVLKMYSNQNEQTKKKINAIVSNYEQNKLAGTGKLMYNRNNAMNAIRKVVAKKKEQDEANRKAQKEQDEANKKAKEEANRKVVRNTVKGITNRLIKENENQQAKIKKAANKLSGAMKIRKQGEEANRKVVRNTVKGITNRLIKENKNQQAKQEAQEKSNKKFIKNTVKGITNKLIKENENQQAKIKKSANKLSDAMKIRKQRENAQKQKEQFEADLKRARENTKVQIEESMKSPENKQKEKNENVSKLQQYANSKENYKQFKPVANNVISNFKFNKTKITSRGIVPKYKNLETAKKAVNNALRDAKKEQEATVKIESAVKRNTEMLDKAAQEKKKARENASKRMKLEKERKEKQKAEEKKKRNELNKIAKNKIEAAVQKNAELLAEVDQKRKKAQENASKRIKAEKERQEKLKAEQRKDKEEANKKAKEEAKEEANKKVKEEANRKAREESNKKIKKPLKTNKKLPLTKTDTKTKVVNTPMMIKIRNEFKKLISSGVTKDSAFRKMAKELHPNKGGSAEQMQFLETLKNDKKLNNEIKSLPAPSKKMKKETRVMKQTLSKKKAEPRGRLRGGSSRRSLGMGSDEFFNASNKSLKIEENVPIFQNASNKPLPDKRTKIQKISNTVENTIKKSGPAIKKSVKNAAVATALAAAPVGKEVAKQAATSSGISLGAVAGGLTAAGVVGGASYLAKGKGKGRKVTPKMTSKNKSKLEQIVKNKKKTLTRTQTLEEAGASGRKQVRARKGLLSEVHLKFYKNQVKKNNPTVKGREITKLVDELIWQKIQNKSINSNAKNPNIAGKFANK
jgi:hypothetical protein